MKIKIAAIVSSAVVAVAGITWLGLREPTCQEAADAVARAPSYLPADSAMYAKLRECVAVRKP